MCWQSLRETLGACGLGETAPGKGTVFKLNLSLHAKFPGPTEVMSKERELRSCEGWMVRAAFLLTTPRLVSAPSCGGLCKAGRSVANSEASSFRFPLHGSNSPGICSSASQGTLLQERRLGPGAVELWPWLPPFHSVILCSVVPGIGAGGWEVGVWRVGVGPWPSLCPSCTLIDESG